MFETKSSQPLNTSPSTDPTRNITFSEKPRVLQTGWYRDFSYEQRPAFQPVYESWTDIQGFEIKCKTRSITPENFDSIDDLRRFLRRIIPHLGLFQFQDVNTFKSRNAYSEDVQRAGNPGRGESDYEAVFNYNSSRQKKGKLYQFPILTEEYLIDQFKFLRQFSPLIFQTAELQYAILEQMEKISEICRISSTQAQVDEFKSWTGRNCYASVKNLPPKDGLRLRVNLLEELAYLRHPSLGSRHFSREWETLKPDYTAGRCEDAVCNAYQGFFDYKDQKEESKHLFHSFLDMWFPSSMNPKDILGRDFWITYLTKALAHFKEKQNRQMVSHIQSVLSFVYYSIHEDLTPRAISYRTETNLPTKEVCLKQGLNLWLETPMDKNNCNFLNCWSTIAWKEAMNDQTCFHQDGFFNCSSAKINIDDEILKSKLRAKVIEEYQLSSEVTDDFNTKINYTFGTPLAFDSDQSELNKIKYDLNNAREITLLALYKEALIRLSWTLEKRKGETRNCFSSIFMGYSAADFHLRKGIYENILTHPLNIGNLIEIMQANTEKLTNGRTQRFFDALLEVRDALTTYQLHLAKPSIPSSNTFTSSATTSSMSINH